MVSQPSPPRGRPVPSTLQISSDESGAALLVAVLILLVVSILGAAVVNMGQVDYALSSNYRSSITAFNLADSGLQAAAADLRADYYADPTDNWLVDWLNMGTTPPSVPTPFPDATGTVVNGFTLSPGSPSPNPYPGTPYDLGGASALGAGSFTRTIWLPPTVTLQNGTPVVNIRVRSTGVDGNVDPANATIDGVVTIELTNSSPYSAGAFLGAGDGGDLIQGGPVRIAGTLVAIGIPGGGPGGKGPGTLLDLTNGSSIVNNYKGIDGASALGSLSSKLPALDVVDLNGESVEDLGAALHLKDVATEMSGAGGQLGEADAPGDSYKETLDGVYTDGTIGPNTDNIYADTVSTSALADDVVFPSLFAAYTDPVTGTDYPSFADFLDNNSYQPITGGDVVISSQTPSFSWVDPAGNGSLAWDASTETLSIDGIVKITGSFNFGDPTVPGGDSLTAINYDGTGVIWATNDIMISKDLYPTGSFLHDGPDPDSEVDGNLGLIASDEIIIDGSAAAGGGGPGRGGGRGEGRGGGRGSSPPGGNDNVQILATLFAETRLRVESPANVAGTVVTNAIYVDNFATLNIWHAPSLGAVSPNGMPVGMMIGDIQVAISEWFQRR